MVILVFALVLLGSWLLLRWWKGISKWDHFPGPSKLTSFPVIGHGHMAAGKPLKQVLKENRARYGDIYRFDIGPIPTVFLCNYADICEAYRTDVFGGRTLLKQPGFVSLKPIDTEDGDIIGLTSRATADMKYKEQKKFFMSTVADLGFGKSPMEDVIIEEVRDVCEELKKKAAADPKSQVAICKVFAPASNNVIWRFVSGNRTKQDDPELIDLMVATKDVFLLFSTDLFKMTQMYSMWFSKVCKWLGVKNNVYDVGQKLNSKLYQMAEQGQPDKHGSFIERHLYMQEELGNNSSSIFSKRQGMDYLKGGLFDLFLAGTDTTSTFMEWILVFLMLYPDAQAKLLREIQETLGDREATLQDRQNLPYVECFIEEVARLCQMVDLAVPHQVEDDVVFKGFLFPKGTQIFADMSAVRTEASYWKDPEEFKPERYLTKEGKFQAEERIATFGIGKRRCMGEVLARAEQFLFTVGMVQNFEFRRQKEGPPPSLLPVSGMISYPQGYDAVVIPRV